MPFAPYRRPPSKAHTDDQHAPSPAPPLGFYPGRHRRRSRPESPSSGGPEVGTVRCGRSCRCGGRVRGGRHGHTKAR
eukprot:158290-Chlamydomonas_euryale.AAC.1